MRQGEREREAGWVQGRLHRDLSYVLIGALLPGSPSLWALVGSGLSPLGTLTPWWASACVSIPGPPFFLPEPSLTLRLCAESLAMHHPPGTVLSDSQMCMAVLGGLRMLQGGEA